MSGQRIRRDDFDVESRDRRDERRGGGRLSDRRSRSSRRSPHSRHRDDDSRSRSRSLDRDRHRGRGYGRDRYSRSRSRSHSRDYSRRRHDSGSSRSRRHRDSRSISDSRSPSYYRRNRRRDGDDESDYMRRNSRSISRSRSRSSSHFCDFSKKDEESKKRDFNRTDDSQDISGRSDNSNEPQNLEDLPLPKQDNDKTPYQFDENEPIDRERIHREMEEKLRQTLAKEGKVYPPPKPEASHPVFANDGSFLEIFKKMQQQQQLQPKATTSSAVASVANPAVPILAASVVNPSTAPYLVATATGKSAPPPPIVGRRKGGKILKTGVVAKPKAQTDSSNDPKDFWSLYLAEVNKYKNTACESEQGNRPLVK